MCDAFEECVHVLKATLCVVVGAVILCLGPGCQRQSSAQVVAHNPTTSGAQTKLSEPLLPAVTATQVTASLNVNVSDSLGPRFVGTAARKAFDSGQWSGCARGFGQVGKQSQWQARAMQLLCMQRSGEPADKAARGFEGLARSGGLLAEHAWLW
ncbi:MAG TPA: hypothetical protein DCQ06_11635, partial [Myxococcales bacterium]|nr:hypothetical protein [Myxococcales bacterium]